MRVFNAALLSAVLLCACGSGARTVTDRMDEMLPHASIGTPGWEYVRVASGDLDGDGTVERAVVLARVPLRDGQPVWDDWNVWQVYVEEPTGERTYVYSSPVQSGRLEPYLTGPDKSGRSSIAIVEHAPTSITLYEIVYDGPNKARLLALAERSIDAGHAFVAPSNVSTPRR